MLWQLNKTETLLSLNGNELQAYSGKRDKMDELDGSGIKIQ